MKNYFQFGDLIEKYSVDFILLFLVFEGFYDDFGKWVEGKLVELEEKGVIVLLQV